MSAIGHARDNGVEAQVFKSDDCVVVARNPAQGQDSRVSDEDHGVRRVVTPCSLDGGVYGRISVGVTTSGYDEPALVARSRPCESALGNPSLRDDVGHCDEIGMGEAHVPTLHSSGSREFRRTPGEFQGWRP